MLLPFVWEEIGEDKQLHSKKKKKRKNVYTWTLWVTLKTGRADGCWLQKLLVFVVSLLKGSEYETWL